MLMSPVLHAPPNPPFLVSSSNYYLATSSNNESPPCNFLRSALRLEISLQLKARVTEKLRERYYHYCGNLQCADYKKEEKSYPRNRLLRLIGL
jgi:hypothetical protein